MVLMVTVLEVVLVRMEAAVVVVVVVVVVVAETSIIVDTAMIAIV